MVDATAPTSKQLSELEYYKAKALMFELQLMETQLQVQHAEILRRRQQLLASHGLPPGVYRLNDETMSIETTTMPEPGPGVVASPAPAAPAPADAELPPPS